MKRIIVVCIFIHIITSLHAQVGGSATYTFLKLTNSARIAALGGENISINDSDLNLVYHNPALLNGAMSDNLVINYVNYFAGINYGYAAYARSFNKAGTFATGIHYINYGKFIKAEASGEITGEFKAFELALNIFWSKPLWDSLITVGVNFKPIYSQMETYKSFGLAFDAGLNYVADNELFSASLVFRNVGAQVKPYVEGNYEPLPFDIQIGITQKLQHAPFRLSLLLHHLYKWDLTYNKNDNLAYTSVPGNSEINSKEDKFNVADNMFRHTILGVEFLPSKNFIVMLGYNHQRRKELMVPTRPFLVGYSWGFYIKISKLRLSFGQSIYHLAGASNHFSLNFNLGDFYKKAN